MSTDPTAPPTTGAPAAAGPSAAGRSAAGLSAAPAPAAGPSAASAHPSASADRPGKSAQPREWSAARYRRLGESLRPLAATLWAGAVDHLGSAPPRTADIGTGHGALALVAAAAGSEVRACDISHAQLDAARAAVADTPGLLGHVDLVEGDAMALPWGDATFDAALSSVGLVFAPDVPRCLTEAARVTRPGGIVGLTTWTSAGWLADARLSLAARLGRDVIPLPTPWPGTFDDATDGVIADLVAAGCADVRVRVESVGWEFPAGEALGAEMLEFFPGLAALARGREDEAAAHLADCAAAFTRPGGGTGSVLVTEPYLCVTAVVR